VELGFLQLKPTWIWRQLWLCHLSAQHAFIYLGAVSRLSLVSASFRNSVKTESVHNSALLQFRYPTLGPKLCQEYLSHPLHIKQQARGSKWFSFGPSYARASANIFKLFLLVSMVYVLLSYWCVISVALLLIPLSRAFKQGGMRAMSKCLDSQFLMFLFFTHVFRSNMSYVVYHWLFEWGGVSESFCESDMCRPWLVSVTLGVDSSLVNWEIFKLRVYPSGISPVFVRNQR